LLWHDGYPLRDGDGGSVTGENSNDMSTAAPPFPFSTSQRPVDARAADLERLGNGGGAHALRLQLAQAFKLRVADETARNVHRPKPRAIRRGCQPMRRDDRQGAWPYRAASTLLSASTSTLPCRIRFESAAANRTATIKDLARVVSVSRVRDDANYLFALKKRSAQDETGTTSNKYLELPSRSL
jgi:hypothetical protein